MALVAAASRGLGQKKFDVPQPPPMHKDALRLGVCSYSLHDFQRNLAISMLKQIGAPYVSVKEFHIPYTVTAEEAAKAVGAFKKAGLTIVSGGTIEMQEDDPAALRRSFDYAKLCGMPMIVAAPTRKTLDPIEKLIEHYDIKVAIHTHGPEDENFPNPQSVLKALGNRDPRMGVCMDLGHSMRTGVDVVETVAETGTRLLDMHIKDLRSAEDKKSQCDVGDGVMPVPRIFKQLLKMNYTGCVNLEYEINSDNPLPGMLHSMGYMRGVLAGLTA